MSEKQALRRQILRRLKTQSKRARQSKSLKIAKRLRRSTLYRRAKVVFCYIAVDHEVETEGILQEVLADGKRLVVPITVMRGSRLIAAEIRDPKKDLKKKGPYGIPQPTRITSTRVAVKDLSLLILPGIAFDKTGSRLGRGKGYFDRFLEKVPAKTPRVGLAFKFQMVKEVPQDGHDQPVTKVITD